MCNINRQGKGMKKTHRIASLRSTRDPRVVNGDSSFTCFDQKVDSVGGSPTSMRRSRVLPGKSASRGGEHVFSRQWILMRLPSSQSLARLILNISWKFQATGGAFLQPGPG
jgi:hypothetical protein